MKALIICDMDYKTEIFHDLQETIYDILGKKEFDIELVEIGTKKVTFCKGCFGCWVKKPGECTMNDAMADINRSYINSDVTVYLSPVIFGQFSANIKNAIDRSLPNMLPFFVTRRDGSTAHPPRYESYPRQIIIGYGEEIAGDDKQLFMDITKKHRGNLEVLIYEGQNDNENIVAVFNQLELAKVEGML